MTTEPARRVLARWRAALTSLVLAATVAPAWAEPDTLARIVPLPTVTVIGERRQVVDPTPVTLSGRRLRASLGRTIAETLAGEPGLSQRTMGPAPARPVLRGFSGNRLLVLEDGASTGDLSATASDHAVVIEPMHSRSVDVVRGPAALLHGSNALGGVIDVRRDLVPTVRPERVTGAVSGQAESVNRGGAGAMRLAVPAGPLVLRADGSVRRALDVRTPAGRLRNTSLDGSDGAFGVSWIGARGHAGFAAGRTSSGYGIPGGFLGGHRNGVDIELERTQSALATSWRPERGPFSRVEGDVRWVRYSHRELESSGACGVAFGVLTGTGSVRAHWPRAGTLGEGKVVLSGEYRDQAQGCLSFMPPTIERSGGVAMYQEWDRNIWSVRAAARVDHRAVAPARRDSNKAGRIRPRAFSGASVGLSAGVALPRGWTVALGTMLTHMPPSVEELFSEGPHLAAYSYEIGNADLGSEHALGLDAQARWTRGGASASVSLFHDRIAGYLHPRDTGQLEVGPGEEGLLERYQYAGLDATMSGGEAAIVLPLGAGFSADGACSVVRGVRAQGGRPLPMIPPVSGRMTLRGSRGAWSVAATTRGAAKQYRVDEYEAATAAWLAADVQLQWDGAGPGGFTSLVATLENLTDADYRQHLSRVRSVTPEPGRNLKLLYRVQW